MKNIAILGAGISGLTTAFLLKKKGHKVSIFEKSHRTGGYIGTQYKQNYVVEIGANGFLNNEPKTLDLINQLDLHNELILSKDDSKIRYVFVNGKLTILPTTPKDFLKSDLLSFGAKLKVIKEMWAPSLSKREPDKVSIFDFIKIHFGSEIAENIARSAIVGIYAGDAKKLSVKKTFKKLVELEKEYKSLLKGMKAAAQNDRKPNLFSFKKGMQTLTDKLTQELRQDILLSHEILEISKNEKFSVKARIDEEEQSFNGFDEIVITLPAMEIPKILSQTMGSDVLTSRRMEQFKNFPMAPVRSFSFAFKEQVNFKGFGALISPKEDLNILGFLHPKDIFENRCSEDKDLFTVMMGGTFKPEIMKMSTQASMELALKDLEKILGKLPQIEQFWIANHSPGISQYNVEYVDFMNEVEQIFLNTPGIHLNSQMLGGVSINDCIAKSYSLASNL